MILGREAWTHVIVLLVIICVTMANADATLSFSFLICKIGTYCNFLPVHLHYFKDVREMRQNA